ncbi:hypothetical protein NGTWS0302_00330 [Mycolicibacterium cyprinidarum]|uniref:Dihydrodipicolinate reductase n=1 Tax=Mycolicibacterium cyprinidarum TaxID=2860311 RepID=A0ABQ4VBY5_9MYCO|nr:hypothetical protein NGTWS0302_00330 [Mycolicibacterium sp. NGTWS0302]GJF16142.1 hypothetical protein NGTWS1702_20580 [Mycolicibacterium sp. NGTWSNA01]
MSTPAAERPLRVIQWTTGNIGQRSLHAIIGRSDMELVGVYAHGADKVGVDAAELSGWLEPTGVKATNDIDELIALRPDACCYNPLWPNIDELVRLLESGINVCSTAAWITGGKQSQQDLDRIRNACERGDSTIFGSGAHPGMSNLVGMVLSGACERVDEIRITESVDCSTYESAGTQTAMGFSQDPDTPGLADSVRRESEVFAESAAMMADAIGATLDNLTFDVTFTAATGDSDLGFMQIPEGTVAGVFGYTGAGSGTAMWSASGSTGPWGTMSPRPSRSSTVTSFRFLVCRICAPWCTACHPRTGPNRDSWVWE